jgi:hypothetical protein
MDRRAGLGGEARCAGGGEVGRPEDFLRTLCENPTSRAKDAREMGHPKLSSICL